MSEFAPGGSALIRHPAGECIVRVVDMFAENGIPHVVVAYYGFDLCFVLDAGEWCALDEEWSAWRLVRPPQ